MPAPAGLYDSVWTGREFIVHSVRSDINGRLTTVGAEYNPARDAWRMLPANPYPLLNVEGGTRAVWTGTEMLTFGQSNAAYNPRTNRWRPLAPGGGGPSVTVWTGRQVLMWGGGCCGDNSAAGSAYDPATNTWRSLPRSPLSGRHTSGVWTGREMLVIGGQADERFFTDGAAYNPTTRTWRTLARMPAPRNQATMTWTGTEVLVVGGYSPGTWPWRILDTALAFNPTTNRWRSLPRMADSRSEHAAVWTGRHLLVWGGITGQYDERSDSYPRPPHGVVYTPATNTWSDLPKAPLRGRSYPNACWTGQEMIVWGGGTPDRPYVDGAAYRPAPTGAAGG